MSDPDDHLSNPDHFYTDEIQKEIPIGSHVLIIVFRNNCSHVGKLTSRTDRTVSIERYHGGTSSFAIRNVRVRRIRMPAKSELGKILSDISDL